MQSKRERKIEERGEMAREMKRVIAYILVIFKNLACDAESIRYFFKKRIIYIYIFVASGTFLFLR